MVLTTARFSTSVISPGIQATTLGITTLLVVTHQMDLVEQFGNRVIAIDDGLVVSDGMEGYREDEE